MVGVGRVDRGVCGSPEPLNFPEPSFTVHEREWRSPPLLDPSDVRDGLTRGFRCEKLTAVKWRVVTLLVSTALPTSSALSQVAAAEFQEIAGLLGLKQGPVDGT